MANIREIGSLLKGIFDAAEKIGVDASAAQEEARAATEAVETWAAAEDALCELAYSFGRGQIGPSGTTMYLLGDVRGLIDSYESNVGAAIEANRARADAYNDAFRAAAASFDQLTERLEGGAGRDAAGLLEAACSHLADVAAAYDGIPEVGDTFRQLANGTADLAARLADAGVDAPAVSEVEAAASLAAGAAAKAAACQGEATRAFADEVKTVIGPMAGAA